MKQSLKNASFFYIELFKNYIGIIKFAKGYPINDATKIITNIIRNPYFNKLVESDQPDEPATAT